MALITLPSAFSHNGYEFKAVTVADLPQIRGWLREPHMSDWWSPDPANLALIGTPEDISARYIISHNGRAFAYLQCDAAEGLEDHPQITGTYELHQFVGDAQMIGFGHGTNFIKTFVSEIKKHPVITRLITTPAPDNAPAIRSYTQSGFRREKVITRDGQPILLMGLTF